MQTSNAVENLIKSKVSLAPMAGRIGNVEVKSCVALAPMAGITDMPLRQLIRKFSSDCLLTTEMISSEYLAQTLNGRSGVEILKRDDNHSPISYQISGHKPHLMNMSAQALTPLADMIDINMGCPVKKVVGGQDGASLMRNHLLYQLLIRLCSIRQVL